MVAGGHFYLLFPSENGKGPSTTGDDISPRSCGGFHCGDLLLTVDYVPVAARDFLEGDAGGHAFAAKWDEVSAAGERTEATGVARSSRTRTSLDTLFEPQEKGGVERTLTRAVTRATYPWRTGLPSARAAEASRIWAAGSERLATCCLAKSRTKACRLSRPGIRLYGPLGWPSRLCNDLQEVAQTTAPPGASSITVCRLDSADSPAGPAGPWSVSGHLDFRWLADATPCKPTGEVAEFSDLGEAAQGAKWLGVLRMDVDSLGELFRSRLGRHGTISRMADGQRKSAAVFRGMGSAPLPPAEQRPR